MTIDTLSDHPPEVVAAYKRLGRQGCAEVRAVAAERVADILADLGTEAADILRRIADIQDAMTERDWSWLADVGVISQHLAAELVAADLSED